MSLIVKIEKKLKNYNLNVDLQIDNSCLGLLGASGSGKSMTLKCIAGIMEPDSGYIELNNKVLYDSKGKINLPPQERNIGYLFQNYALFPNMNVYENISIGLKSKKIEVVHEFIKKFDLVGLENQYPRKLSGGQQQRVALARMLISNPSVLLFDEPFSALDSHLKDRLQVLVKDLLDDFLGDSIFVTHNREETYYFCENIAIINSGEIIEKSSAINIFNKPRKKETAKLIGCKNISKIDIIDNNVLAINWNCVFENIETLDIYKTYIGIRACDFVLCEEKDDFPNKIKCKIKKIIDTPTLWNVLLEVLEGNNDHTLWWQYNKGEENFILNIGDSVTLSIETEKILFLEE